MPNAFDSYIAKQCGYALHLDSLTASVQPTPSATDSESKDLRAQVEGEFDQPHPGLRQEQLAFC